MRTDGLYRSFAKVGGQAEGDSFHCFPVAMRVTHSCIVLRLELWNALKENSIAGYRMLDEAISDIGNKDLWGIVSVQ